MQNIPCYIPPPYMPPPIYAPTPICPLMGGRDRGISAVDAGVQCIGIRRMREAGIQFGIAPRGIADVQDIVEGGIPAIIERSGVIRGVDDRLGGGVQGGAGEADHCSGGEDQPRADQEDDDGAADQAARRGVGAEGGAVGGDDAGASHVDQSLRGAPLWGMPPSYPLDGAKSRRGFALTPPPEGSIIKV